MGKVRSEDQPHYGAATPASAKRDDEDITIALAIRYLGARLRAKRQELTVGSPKDATDYLQLRFGAEEREVFAVLFFDTRHRLIECEVVSIGTLASASVYPREIVKAALRHNAAAVIVAHNHPSGTTDPSSADISITRKIQEALALVDVRVLDHVVVSATETTSFATAGLLPF